MGPGSGSAARQRSERRIEVHLPMHVRGRDACGATFEEDTSSENLCRGGAAFLTRFDMAIGSDLEIRIPFSNYAARRGDADFSTSGRVIHVRDAASLGERDRKSTRLNSSHGYISYAVFCLKKKKKKIKSLIRYLIQHTQQT